MSSVPFYQILDFRELFRDSIFKKQFDLCNSTAIKPLSYFNTLPSGDLVSDADFDTFLCEQMFQEDFEFTVADDMSIGRTTFQMSVGKKESTQFNFLKVNQVSGQNQSKLKRLRTFTLGDRAPIPCSTGDTLSREGGFGQDSGLSSRASIWNDTNNQPFQSLRHIDAGIPTPPMELSCQEKEIVLVPKIEVQMPEETPATAPNFLKRPPSNLRQLPQPKQTSIIEEANEEAGNFSSVSKVKRSSNSSKAHSCKSWSQEKSVDPKTPATNEAKDGNDLKRKLLVFTNICKSDNEVKRNFTTSQDHSSEKRKKTLVKLYEEGVSNLKMNSDTNLMSFDNNPISLLELKRGQPSGHPPEPRKSQGNDRSNQSYQLVHSGETKPAPRVFFASGNSQKPGSASEARQKLHFSQPNEEWLKNVESAAKNRSYLSELDKKILEVKLRNQQLDLATQKAKGSHKLGHQEIVSAKLTNSSLEAIHNLKKRNALGTDSHLTPKKSSIHAIETRSNLQSTVKPRFEKQEDFGFKSSKVQSNRTANTVFGSAILAKLVGSSNTSETNQPTNPGTKSKNSTSISKAAPKTNKGSKDSDSEDEILEFHPQKEPSPQQQRLRRLAELRVPSDAIACNSILIKELSPKLPSKKKKIDFFKLTEVENKLAEKIAVADSVSSGSKEYEHHLTSREKDSPFLASNYQTRLSANESHAAKQPKKAGSPKRKVHTVSSLVSKYGIFQSSTANDLKLKVADNKIVVDKGSVSDIKSCSLLDAEEFYNKTRSEKKTGEPVIGHKQHKSIKIEGLIPAATKDISQRGMFETRELIKTKNSSKDFRSKLSQLLNNKNKQPN